MDLQRGQLNEHVLTPEKLRQIADDIKTNHQRFELPIPREHLRLEEVSRISKLDACQWNEDIIVFINIPLVTREVHTLYHLHPLPAPQRENGEYLASAFIQPRAEALLWPEDGDNYFSVNLIDLNINCIQRHYAWICEPFAVSKKITTATECEVTVLSKQEISDMNNCDIELQKQDTTQWVRLKTSHSWIFSTNSETKIRITTPKSIEQGVRINSTGLILLGERDSITTKDFTIRGWTEEGNTQLDHLPDYELNVTEVIRKQSPQEAYEKLKTLKKSLMADMKVKKALRGLLTPSGGLNSPPEEQVFCPHLLIYINFIATVTLIIGANIVIIMWRKERHRITFIPSQSNEMSVHQQVEDVITHTAHEAHKLTKNRHKNAQPSTSKSITKPLAALTNLRHLKTTAHVTQPQDTECIA